MDDLFVSLVTAAIIAVALVLYAVPSYLAYRAGRVHRHAVLLLNLVAGWTLIGWIAALIWACSGETERSRYELAKDRMMRRRRESEK